MPKGTKALFLERLIEKSAEFAVFRMIEECDHDAKELDTTVHDRVLSADELQRLIERQKRRVNGE